MAILCYKLETLLFTVICYRIVSLKVYFVLLYIYLLNNINISFLRIGTNNKTITHFTTQSTHVKGD